MTHAFSDNNLPHRLCSLCTVEFRMTAANYLTSTYGASLGQFHCLSVSTTKVINSCLQLLPCGHPIIRARPSICWISVNKDVLAEFHCLLDQSLVQERWVGKSITRKVDREEDGKITSLQVFVRLAWAGEKFSFLALAAKMMNANQIKKF